jgi:hypothetical protein
MVTITDISKAYPYCSVKQVGSKQLFIIEGEINNTYQKVLISYKTIIGRFYAGIWFITNEKYSVTTTRQANQFIKDTSFTVTRLNDISLDSVKEYLVNG